MLLELAVGDAYGAGFEFRNRLYVRAFNTLERHRRPALTLTTAGRYTDDTQMTMAVTEAMLSGQTWSAGLLADRFVEAFRRDPRPGYAPGFHRLLRSVRSGDDFLARIRPDSDGGGAAMRAGPLGVLAEIDDVLQRAELQARITHDTPGGAASAQAAALMVHYFVHRLGPPGALGGFVARHVPGEWEQPWTGRVGMNGVANVRAAITAVGGQRSLADLLRTCVAYSGDVDTVATIGLAAASWSEDYTADLPAVLIDGLETGAYGRGYLEKLDRQLVAFASRARSVPGVTARSD
jgi:ADP-ribosyl-[dinitrogen reductase] hydrolase